MTLSLMSIFCFLAILEMAEGGEVFSRDKCFRNADSVNVLSDSYFELFGNKFQSEMCFLSDLFEFR